MLHFVEFCNFWGESELTGMCHGQLGPVLLSPKQESVDNFSSDNIIFSLPLQYPSSQALPP